MCQEKIMSLIQETMLNIKITNDLINNLPHMDTLRAVLSFFKSLLLNKFDKSLFLNANAPSTILKVISRLIELKLEDYKNSSYLCIIFKEAMQTLYVL